MAQVKTKKEIEYIKKACQLGDEIFLETLSFIKQSRKQKITPTEKEVKSFILYKIKEYKLRSSFSPIVTSSKNAGNEIHPESTNEKIKGFTIIDLGVRYKGYCSDKTRTIYIGTPTQKEKGMYVRVLKSQLLGIKLTTSGSHAWEIDKKVRKSLSKYKKYFIHTLGHGIGKKIHEPPVIYEKRTKPVLKNSMIITIEPGIYIPNKLGIRIEDTVVVQKDKPLVLTRSSKKLITF